jgi:hypothetical protein
MENWKDIKGYEGGYQVSDLGNVRFLGCHGVNGYNRRPRNLKQTLNNGYPCVGLNFNGKKMHARVHQLVAIAFLNHAPCGYNAVVDHIDNNKLNNELSNLQVISHRENISKDRVKISSKYTGVFPTKNKWQASIRIDGVQYHLGNYNTEIDASEAYKKSLIDHQNGDFNPKKYNPFVPSSRCPGVYYDSFWSKWRCKFKTEKKEFNIGYFKTEEEAIIAYNMALKDHKDGCLDLSKFKKKQSSKFKGVSFNKSSGKWISYINRNKERTFLGCYNTEQEAINARLNFVD